MFLKKAILALLFTAAATSFHAAAQGYPDVYLRGTFNGWSAEDNYKFSRNGDLYAIYLSSANGNALTAGTEFKIATADWAGIDFGSQSADKEVFDGLGLHILGLGGQNLIAGNLDDVSISFNYNDATSPKLTVNVTSGDIRADWDDDVNNYPVVYLRGTMDKAWSTLEAYKFQYKDGIYSLTISESKGNTLAQGTEFKIATADWNTVDFGADGTNGFNFDNSGMMNFKRAGGNVVTANGVLEGTISFGASQIYDNYLTVNVVIDKTVSGIQPSPYGTSGTLPVLYINVYTDDTHTTLNNEVIDKDLSHKNYFSSAEYWLDINDCEWLKALGAKSVGSADAPLPLEIKARGNYTRTAFAKKPFKLKLGKKQDLLALTPDKSKHYALLAHADDGYGYLRNFTMFSLGKRIGLPWTPSQQPVEVVINGNYRGLYFLTESIRVGDGRLDITELDDNVSDPSLVSGGYIVELDNYNEPDDAQIRMDEKSCVRGHYLDLLRVTFDTPEVYSDLQRRFITDQFTAINDCVGANSNNTWTYLDLDDAARYYIVKEILSDVESFHGSTYLFRDYGHNQKWHFSPLWDAGNSFNGSTSLYLYDDDPFGNTWIPSLRANAMFNSKVRQTWLWFMSNGFDGIYDEMADYADKITAAAKADRARWNGQPTPGGGQPVVDNANMADKLNAALSRLRDKVEWLRHQPDFGDYTASTFTEPERDTTEAAPLPPYVSTAIDELPADELDPSQPAEYYNLQGMRILNPVPGQIYIVRQADRYFKLIK